jgi:divalent metal cation (Fe/Co/Zn/Cd) transporter
MSAKSRAAALSVASNTSLVVLKLAVGHLLDRGLPGAELEVIRDILRRHPAVLESHRLRTRKSGSHRHIDAHVTMRGDISLAASHAAADERTP